MEEEKKEEVFEDFGEETDFVSPNMDELDKKTEEKEEEIIIPEFSEENVPLEENAEAEQSENIENQEELQAEEPQETPQEKPELNNWEEADSSNKIIKKYIINVERENIEDLDLMEVEDRNKFINEAIKLKKEADDENAKERKRKHLITHFVLMIVTAIVFLPFAFYLAHLCIVATFENYKYSQENIEKLYKESFKNDKIYVRSMNHNKKYNKEEKDK